VFFVKYGIIVWNFENTRNTEVCTMAVQTDERLAKRIEELAGEAEIMLEEDDNRKDLKEKRGAMKQSLYDGSKKLKHTIPKGKHV
jgi:hypothetical protein